MLNVILKQEIGEPDQKTLHYDSIDEFLDEFVTDDIIMQWLNDIYGEMQIPGLGFIETGFAVYAITQQSNDDYNWDLIRSDFIQMEIDYIEETLSAEGEMHYYDCILIDPNFEAEEE